MLKEKYDNLNSEICTLLENMLSFNPDTRFDINQCL